MGDQLVDRDGATAARLRWSRPDAVPLTGAKAGAPWADGRTQIIGHRGAPGLVVESTVAGFLHAVRQGATALELDVQLTADGQVVVWHDPVLVPEKAVDTGPATLADSWFPYVGRRLIDLSYGQLACVDVGRRAQACYPGQACRPAARIPLLAEILQTVHELDPSVWFLIELKVDPTRPDVSAPPAAMVSAVLEVVESTAATDRAVIQSFDWRVLELARAQAAHVPRAALAVVGRTFAPSSPWLGSVRFEDHPHDLLSAVAAVGASAVAPAHGLCAGCGHCGRCLVPDRAFVERAHELGLAVLPWTVNSTEHMQAVLAAGADGLITDYPNRAAGLPPVR